MVKPEGGLGLLWQNAYKIFSIVSSQSLSLLNTSLTAAPEAESNERRWLIVRLNSLVKGAKKHPARHPLAFSVPLSGVYHMVVIYMYGKFKTRLPLLYAACAG